MGGRIPRSPGEIWLLRPEGDSGCLLSCQCGTHGRAFQGARAASGRCSVPVTPAPAPAPVKPPGPALCSRASTAERSPYPGLRDTYYWRTGPTFRIRLPSCLGHVCVSRPPRLLPQNITPSHPHRAASARNPCSSLQSLEDPPVFRSAHLQGQPLKAWPPCPRPGQN